ncbi:MAG: hypothetical protein ACLFU0_11670, partial [Alphaproteobacteria bacterium]
MAPRRAAPRSAVPVIVIPSAPSSADRIGPPRRERPIAPENRIERRALQKLSSAPQALAQRVERRRTAAMKGAETIERAAVADAAGRDGFGLARWSRSRGIERHVIHPTGVAVSRRPGPPSRPAAGVATSASKASAWPRVAPAQARPTAHPSPVRPCRVARDADVGALRGGP